MERQVLLDKLGKATDRAALFAIHRGFPVPLSDTTVLVGNALIEKNKNNSFDVVGIDRTPLYANISIFDIAVIIAQKYSIGEHTSIKNILFLEDKYEKYHTDMIHYLNCMKSAKKQNDTERLSILEDKFQIAEMIAKDTRDKLAKYKRAK